jgi:hypothetical protein
MLRLMIVRSLTSIIYGVISLTFGLRVGSSCPSVVLIVIVLPQLHVIWFLRLCFNRLCSYSSHVTLSWLSQCHSALVSKHLVLCRPTWYIIKTVIKIVRHCAIHILLVLLILILTHIIWILLMLLALL